MKILILLILTCLSTHSFTQEDSKPFYKNNVSIKPFSANHIGLGIGIQYERYLDLTNNFSIVVPFDYSFEAFDQNNFNTNSSGFLLNPGLRFYFVEPRAFNWYLGTSFAYGSANSDYTTYDPFGNPSIVNQNTKSFGTLVNVGFKGTIKDRFTYNVELGNGIKFYESTNIDDPYSSRVNRYLTNFTVGFGYNF